MAKKLNLDNIKIANSSYDQDSEQEVPMGHRRIKKREDSAGFLGVNSKETNPLLNTDKPVTFSSNRRKRNPPKNSPNYFPKPKHTKTASAVTTKEQSQASQQNRNKSMRSISQKVSEKPEEEEASSQRTKPKVKSRYKSEKELPDIITEQESEQPVQLSSWGLKTCFFFICLTNILVNVDHGWIPACTVTIKRDLRLDNASLGVLGSVVFVGLLIGSFTSPPIFHSIPVKVIILFCILFNTVWLVGFTLFVDFFILWGFRFGVGFFQVFLCIYFPVWIDIFGREDQKTIWLTILQSSVPLGVVLGYGITAIFDSEFGRWQISYYLQALVYFFLFFVFACIPTKYIEDQSAERETVIDEEEEQLQKPSQDAINELDEDDEGYISSSENEEDGYQWDKSSKLDNSSLELSFIGK